MTVIAGPPFVPNLNLCEYAWARLQLQYQQKLKKTEDDHLNNLISSMPV
jgi:hypothetical protein